MENQKTPSTFCLTLAAKQVRLSVVFTLTTHVCLTFFVTFSSNGKQENDRNTTKTSQRFLHVFCLDRFLHVFHARFLYVFHPCGLHMFFTFSLRFPARRLRSQQVSQPPLHLVAQPFLKPAVCTYMQKYAYMHME